MSDVLTIYVDNRADAAPEYVITEDLLRRVLGPRAQSCEIAIRTSGEVDISILRRATHFIGSGFDTGQIAAHGRNLQTVHCTSAGVERYLPLDWLPPGAVFTNSSGVHAEKGGAWGAMSILMLNEQIPLHVTNQQARSWRQAFSSSIAGKTVLILGLGALGEAVAQRIRPFGVSIIGIRRHGGQSAHADVVATPAQLSEFLPGADFVVLTCPLTAETSGLVGRAAFERMKPGAGLINMSRAGVMDYDALIDALNAGTISGAICDVFDPEPLDQTSRLWATPNLIMTPHVSCDDQRNYIERCLTVFRDNIERDTQGPPLINVVDRSLGY